MDGTRVGESLSKCVTLALAALLLLLLPGCATAPRDGLPPVSLTVKNASLSQTLEALNRSLSGYPEFDTRPQPEIGTYTLDVRNKSLWEVYIALQEQNQFALQAGGLGLWVRPIPGPVRPWALSGPALAMVDSIRYVRDSGTSAASPNFLTLRIMVAIDPRLPFVELKPLTVVRAADARGQNLMPPTDTRGSPVSWSPNIFPVALQSIHGMENKFDLTCETTLTAQTAGQTATIPDLAHAVNHSVRLGNGRAKATVTIAEVTPVNDGALRVRVKNSAAPGTSLLPVCRILDSRGKLMYVNYMSGGPAETDFTILTPPDAVGPFSLQAGIPTATAEIPLRFVFHDLTLP